MTGMRVPLFIACFAGLAVTAALVAGRVVDPGITPLLLATVAVATLAGAPGVIRRRAWPVAVLLLPIGAYLLARVQVPVPPQTDGAGAHLAFYGGQLQAGAAAYARDVFPLQVAGKADLRLVLSLIVYAAVGAAAFFALSLRRPLPAIAILLILAGFGFTTDESARDLWPALAFVLLAGGMLALSRSITRERLRRTDAFAGGVTAALAAVLALLILGTTAVEAGRPLGNWRSWDFIGPGTAHFRFDGMQNYPQLLEPDQDTRIMRVRSPVAAYWRANVLPEFTGTRWRGGAPDGRELQASPKAGDWVYEVPPLQPAPQGRLLKQRFEIEATYTDRLFAGGWPTEVRASLRLDLKMTGAAAIAVRPPRGPTLDYTVTAVVPDLKPTDLVGRGRYYPQDVVSRYTMLPFPARDDADGPSPEQEWRAATAPLSAGREWLDLYRLNERIVGVETDPYRMTLAIQEYLRSRHVYSLRPPDAGFDSPYAEFLFSTRTGYCQHFAGAMAVLLRFNGIPARVVVGFTSGEQERPGVFVVSRNDAHAWVEAYFPGVGWAQFEPTPGRRIPSAGDAPASGPGAAAAAALSSATASPTPTPGPGDAGRARVTDPGGPGIAAAAPVETRVLPAWALMLLVVLAAVPAGRALLRRRGLLRGSREARLRASMALMYADLRDHGVDVRSSQTIDETARYLDRQLGIDAGDLPARVQAVAFGGWPATDADLKDLAALRARVRARLRTRSGRVRAVLALYGIHPASSSRHSARPAAAATHARPGS